MKVRDLTNIALFAALMGVLGMIPAVPLPFTPVPITLQTVGMFLTGGLLRTRLAVWSQVLFLLLVAVGLPLLSGGRGGLSVFVGPSAGYIFGFAIVAFCISFTFSRIKVLTFKKIFIINLLYGIGLLYCIGIPVQAVVTNISIIDIAKVSLVYLPGDLVKLTIASLLVYKLRNSSVIKRQLSKAS
ncbi:MULTISPECIES: biotin transporter BioY [Bacillus]|uniref:biotin transporter BioY n=1 Tax=Bacillus TaxID=1386 RepID=UPI0002EAAA26|nr:MULTISPECIES: biotin transporter BioY [Bacillus]